MFLLSYPTPIPYYPHQGLTILPWEGWFKDEYEHRKYFSPKHPYILNKYVVSLKEL